MGSSLTSTSAGSSFGNVIEHWNGTAWTVVASPSPGTFDSELTAAAETATNNAWAVGLTFLDDGEATLTEHWNGSAWTVMPSP